MLMAWGPFRFTIPTYSVETIRRATQPRVEEVPIIQAAPSIHRLGPGNEKITLTSTFHPHHLNVGGLAQLNGVRAAVNALTAYQLIALNGADMNVFGPWIATSVEDTQEMFDPVGKAAIVQATLEMTRYDGGGYNARQIAMTAAAGALLSLF